MISDNLGLTRLMYTLLGWLEEESKIKPFWDAANEFWVFKNDRTELWVGFSDSQTAIYISVKNPLPNGRLPDAVWCELPKSEGVIDAFCGGMYPGRDRRGFLKLSVIVAFLDNTRVG